jgi:hypothetical protein
VELTTRHIRRNEAAVVELCRRLREAEFTYADRVYDGTAGFAQKINSTPGERDGLFWLGNEDERAHLGRFLLLRRIPSSGLAWHCGRCSDITSGFYRLDPLSPR